MDEGDEKESQRLLLRTLGSRVRHLRKARKLTLEDVAERAGHNWSASDLSRFERGTRAINIAKFLWLTEGLGVNASDILYGPPGDVETDDDE